MGCVLYLAGVNVKENMRCTLSISEVIAQPAIGFTDEGQADDYRDSLEREPWLTGHANHERFYLPNRHQAPLTTELLAEPRNFQRRSDPSKHIYRDATGERTRDITGAFNTLLVAGGKRSVKFISGVRHKAIEEINYLSRECYVVWRQGDGRPFDQPAVSLRQRVKKGYADDAEVEVVRSEAVATRRARTLLFARRRHVMVDVHERDASGIRWLYQTHVIRVEVEVMDRDGSKPDTLRMLVSGGHDSGWDGKYEPCVLPAELDQGWHDMLAEAVTGFERECVDCTPELEKKYEEVLAAARETHRAIASERALRRGYGGGGYSRY